MGDLDYLKAYARLKTENDFYCNKNVQTKFDCIGCEYMYEVNGVIKCLKKNIRDWVLFRIDKSGLS